MDRLRTLAGPILLAVGRAFARVSPSPWVWTILGVSLSVLAGIGYSVGGYSGQASGGLLVLAAGLFDVVDGAVARVTGTSTRRGAFMDSTLDRVAEVAVYAGILYSGLASGVIVLLALSASLIVSYLRAKGDALGVSLSGVGVGERSERLILLAGASLLGLVYWGVVGVLVIAVATAAERTRALYAQLR